MPPSVKARYLLAWLVLSSALAVVLVGAMGLLPATGKSSKQLADGLLVWLLYPVLVSITLLHARAAGLGVREVIGRPIDRGVAWRNGPLAIPLFGFALISLYAVFAPLSLVWPAGVQTWLFEDQIVLYDPGPPFRPFLNLLTLSALAVAAPVAEEWFFRGLLLRRWSIKWSPRAGIVGSSLIFAALHADLVGAFVFGIVMCVLYTRSGSLWVPVLVHMAYNSLVAAFVIFAEHTGLLVGPETVEQFRAAWWMPTLGAVLLLPWLHRLRARASTSEMFSGSPPPWN